MKKEHVEKIKGYYDRDGEFKKNERYSGKDKTVYTKDSDKFRWLVMQPKGASVMEVSQTDTHGRITARYIRKREERSQMYGHRAAL